MIPWYKSHAFVALIQTSVLMVLGWLAVALSTNVWDWRTGLAVPLVSNLIIVFKTMWSPTTQGPFDFMNKASTSQVPPKS
jgi:hypothetical protein